MFSEDSEAWWNYLPAIALKLPAIRRYEFFVNESVLSDAKFSATSSNVIV